MQCSVFFQSRYSEIFMKSFTKPLGSWMGRSSSSSSLSSSSCFVKPLSSWMNRRIEFETLNFFCLRNFENILFRGEGVAFSEKTLQVIVWLLSSWKPKNTHWSQIGFILISFGSQIKFQPDWWNYCFSSS